MKTNKTLFVLSTILVFLFNCNVFSQDQDTHYIDLYVDTAVISSQNASSVSSFNQEEGVSNEEYTISARVGDLIIWRGFSSVSEDDTVNIKSINYQGGVNIFNRNILKGNGEEPELVIATIVTGNVGDTLKYDIAFKVLNDGTSRRGTYHIDPKIRIKN